MKNKIFPVIFYSVAIQKAQLVNKRRYVQATKIVKTDWAQSRLIKKGPAWNDLSLVLQEREILSKPDFVQVRFCPLNSLYRSYWTLPFDVKLIKLENTSRGSAERAAIHSNDTVEYSKIEL